MSAPTTTRAPSPAVPALYAERGANGSTAFYFDREGWEWAFTDRRDWQVGDMVDTQRGVRRIALCERPGTVMLGDGTCTYAGSALAVAAEHRAASVRPAGGRRAA